MLDAVSRANYVAFVLRDDPDADQLRRNYCSLLAMPVSGGDATSRVSLARSHALQSGVPPVQQHLLFRKGFPLAAAINRTLTDNKLEVERIARKYLEYHGVGFCPPTREREEEPLSACDGRRAARAVRLEPSTSPLAALAAYLGVFGFYALGVVAASLTLGVEVVRRRHVG